MTFGEKLKQIRLDKGMSQQDFANILGTSKQVISRYELGQTTPKIGVAAEWCQILGVNLDNMLNDSKGVYDVVSDTAPLPSNILPMPKTYKVPLLGTIACGEPILAVENIDTYIDVPEEIRCDFTLRCKGDSMINARIFDGDIVYVREQPDVENGEIAAVLVDGTETEATLKRVYKSEGQIMLMPENSAYQPKSFSGEDMNKVRILGKAVAFTSMVR